MPERDTVEAVPEVLGLEEFQDMLENRVREWNEELREEGRKEGLQKGLRQGRREGEAELLIRQIELRFRRLDEETRKRIRAADADRLLQWGERILTARRLSDVFAVGPRESLRRGMVKDVKLRQAGGSVSATLPKDMVERLHLAIETERGILLT
jgi:hypothetical protein